MAATTMTRATSHGSTTVRNGRYSWAQARTEDAGGGASVSCGVEMLSSVAISTEA